MGLYDVGPLVKAEPKPGRLNIPAADPPYGPITRPRGFSFFLVPNLFLSISYCEGMLDQRA